MQKSYIEHSGKVVEDKRFSHTMALFLNPKTDFKDGAIRCITSRKGKVNVAGYVDKSKIYKVKQVKKLEKYVITEPLDIKGEDDLIKKLSFDDLVFLGFEDPDIIIDPDTNRIHLYFTIPFVDKPKGLYRVYLGHAEGEELDSLEMTDPVLPPGSRVDVYSKELALAPMNKNGVRLNLFESKDENDEVYNSTIRVAIVKNLSMGWKLGKTLLYPKNINFRWCGGHVSPGPILPREFIDVGEGKLLGILNGREANRQEENKIIYENFSVGLMIYNYEKGKIEWISERPIIVDSEAKHITFSSQFIQRSSNKGILYAHVDDSFVRAYSLFSNELKKLLP